MTPDFVGLLSEPPSSPAGRVRAREPYRDLIEEKLSRGRNAKAVWQDLVTDHGYPGNYQTVKRFVRKLQGSRLPQATGIILTAPGEEGPSRLRQWPSGTRPANGQVPEDQAVRADPGVQPQMHPFVDVAVPCPHLGRTP